MVARGNKQTSPDKPAVLDKFKRLAVAIGDTALVAAAYAVAVIPGMQTINRGLIPITGHKDIKGTINVVSRGGTIKQDPIKSVRHGIKNLLSPVKTPDKTKVTRNSSAIFAQYLNMVLGLTATDRQGNQRRYRLRTHSGVAEILKTIEDLGLIEITSDQPNGQSQNAARAEAQVGNFRNFKKMFDSSGQNRVEQRLIEFIIKRQDISEAELFQTDDKRISRLKGFVNGKDFSTEIDKEGHLTAIKQNY
jgi:hypothetical protein